MKKLILPLVAVVLAVAGSAFTTIQKKANATGDLVWFLVDGSGHALDPDAGVQRDTPPTECLEPNGTICAVALSISQSEVEQNGSMYSIAPAVDETDPGVYDDEGFKN